MSYRRRVEFVLSLAVFIWGAEFRWMFTHYPQDLGNYSVIMSGARLLGPPGISVPLWGMLTGLVGMLGVALRKPVARIVAKVSEMSFWAGTALGMAFHISEFYPGVAGYSMLSVLCADPFITALSAFRRRDG